MRTGFFGTKKDKFCLCLDIGTEAVKALISKKENSKISILSSSREYFERYGVFDSKDFGADVMRKTILKALVAVYQGIEEQGLSQKNLSVLLGVAPNIFKARIVWQSFQRKRPEEKISKAEEETIRKQVFKEALKEISQRFATEFGILPGELQWITLKFLGLKIDGYPVPELQRYEGKNLEFKILATFLPKYFLENIKRIFEDWQMEVQKIVHIAESLPIVFKGEKIDGTFLDVGGEISQFFLVKKGELQKINDFKTGGKTFSQGLAEALGISEESARILKERYSNKILSAEATKRVKEFFLEEKKNWYESLKLKIKEKKAILLSPIFLFGGGSLLPEIQDVLKENGMEVKFIYPKDLKDIEDQTKKIKSPQYTPSLLLSYAKEVF